jgi:hypothetical protein
VDKYVPVVLAPVQGDRAAPQPGRLVPKLVEVVPKHLPIAALPKPVLVILRLACHFVEIHLVMELNLAALAPLTVDLVAAASAAMARVILMKAVAPALVIAVPAAVLPPVCLCVVRPVVGQLVATQTRSHQLLLLVKLLSMAAVLP